MVKYIKNLEYYMSLPYNFIMQHFNDEDGEVYFVRVLELDGCASHGKTVAEAFENIHEAMEGYLEVKLEYGDPIPEPLAHDDYKGSSFSRRLFKAMSDRQNEDEVAPQKQYAF